MAQTNLVTRVQRSVARAFSFLCATPKPGPSNAPAKVILAVSGGADSLCLADATLAIAEAHALSPVIFHFNHQLRGPDADADAAFVTEFAAAHNVAAYVFSQNIALIAQAQGKSVEVTGREARYAQLAALAAEIGAAAVATAHHADDQAETVLMRLLRGTGLSGLRGMRQHDWLANTHADVQTGESSNTPTRARVALVRPLLIFSRAHIEQYCADRGLQPRHDATNADVAIARNRIRHELLPYLAQYNPNIRGVLTRLADSAAGDIEIVHYATQQAMRDVTHPTSVKGVGFNRAAWRALPAGLQRATLREAVKQIKGELVDLKYAAIEEARDVLLSNARVGEIALQADVRITVGANTFEVVGVEP